MTATLGRYGKTFEGARPIVFSRRITFPNGKAVFAEVAIEPEDLVRGLMFRERLDPDEGMLFVHPNTGSFPIHMRNTLMPLDVVWISSSGRIVEMARGLQPCKSDDCPTFGGRVPSAFTLELAAGTIARNGLKPGDIVTW